MRPTSVRLRLVGWNVGALAIALIGFALVVHYTVRLNLSGNIDRDLTLDGRHAAAEWAEFRKHPWPPPGGRPGAGPGQAGVKGDRPGGGPGPGGPPPWFRPRRPRPRPGAPLQPGIFDAKTKPLVPFSRPTPWDPAAAKTCLASRQEVFSTVEIGGTPHRVFSVPLLAEGKVHGLVQIARSLGELNQLLAGLSRTLVTLMPLALLAAALGGLLLTSRALSPVRHLSEAAASLGSDDLSRRLPVTGGHEFAELARTFNGLLSRLEEAFRKLEAAYERQRQFAADASHELRTPLAAIKANASLALSRSRSPKEYAEALVWIDSAADTMTRLVGDLLTLARSDSGALHLDLQPTLVEDVVQQAVRDVTSGRRGAEVRTETTDRSLCVRGDFDSLTRLLVNVLDNALRHTPPEGEVTVSVTSEGDTVLLKVSDTGEGIAAEHLPRLCERFYRVDKARSRDQGGVGLGLAICQSLAEAHGGSLSIESTEGEGTTVTVALPRAVLEPNLPGDVDEVAA